MSPKKSKTTKEPASAAPIDDSGSLVQPSPEGSWLAVALQPYVQPELKKVDQELRDENARSQKRLADVEARVQELYVDRSAIQARVQELDARVQALEVDWSAMRAELQEMRGDRPLVLAAQAISVANEDLRKELQLGEYSTLSVADCCENPFDPEVKRELWDKYVDKHHELTDQAVWQMLAWVTSKTNEIAHPATEERAASRDELFQTFQAAIQPKTPAAVAALNSLVAFVWSAHESASVRSQE